MVKIKEAVLSITSRCNLHCKICDIPVSSKNKIEMTTNEIKLLIDDLERLKAKSLIISGGEPLLRKDIFEIIAYAKNKNLDVYMPSNGILIKDDIAKKLHEADINVVNISIEGPKEIHEIIRGKGNYEKSLKALKNLKKYDIATTIATTVTKKNYMHLPFIAKLAKTYNATTIKLQPFSNDFLTKGKDTSEFQLTKEDVKELNSYIKGFIDLSNEYKISTNPEPYLYSISDYFLNNLSNKGCDILYNSVAIDSNGNVYPCWPLSSIILGNLKKERFIDIIKSNQYRNKKELINKCPGCLMSCYDKSFEEKKIKKIIKKIKCLIK